MQSVVDNTTSSINTISSGVSNSLNKVSAVSSSGLNTIKSAVPTIPSISRTPDSLFRKPPVESSFTSLSVFKIIAAIAILAILGFNIFSYLAKGTDIFGNILRKTTDILSSGTKSLLERSKVGTDVVNSGIRSGIKGSGNVMKKVTNNAADGAKMGIDITSGTVNRGVNIVNDAIDHSESKLSNTINNYPGSKSSQNPSPDDGIGSSIQKKNSKGGWCYVGSDRSYRSCIKVKESDVCMSGDIFPTKEICINPNLRQ
tara:strand:- start:1118 stop:1888 length:771 start_codon:yes stop_codon:yes gene_type:complete